MSNINIFLWGSWLRNKIAVYNIVFCSYLTIQFLSVLERTLVQSSALELNFLRCFSTWFTIAFMWSEDRFWLFLPRYSHAHMCIQIVIGCCPRRLWSDSSLERIQTPCSMQQCISVSTKANVKLQHSELANQVSVHFSTKFSFCVTIPPLQLIKETLPRYTKEHILY